MRNAKKILMLTLALSMLLAMIPAVPAYAADCTHNYVLSGITASGHTMTCTLCDTSYTENHITTVTQYSGSWNSATNDPLDVHKVSCNVCGITYNQGHLLENQGGFLWFGDQYKCSLCEFSTSESDYYECNNLNHSYQLISYTDDQHFIECIDASCIQTVTEAHTWDVGTDVTSEDSSYMVVKYTCTAGCVKYEYTKLNHEHIWSETEYIGNGQCKKTCTICGYVVTWDGYPIEDYYKVSGEYSVSVQTFGYDADTGDGITEVRFYYPSALENSSQTWPVVVICNGSGSGFDAGDADKYIELFELLASWGFIVICNNDENSGTGDSAEFTLDLLLTHNDDSSSIFYGKVNKDAVGVFGHSQGGCGAINAASVTTNASYYKAIFLASCAEAGRAEGVGYPYADNRANAVNVPCMMISGATGTFELTIAGGPEALIYNYEAFNTAVGGINESFEHGDTIVGAKGYVVAWFRYVLMNDIYAGAAFHGNDAEFLNNLNWQGSYSGEYEGTTFAWTGGAKSKNTKHIFTESTSDSEGDGVQTTNCLIAGCNVAN